MHGVGEGEGIYPTCPSHAITRLISRADPARFHGNDRNGNGGTMIHCAPRVGVPDVFPSSTERCGYKNLKNRLDKN